MLVGGGKCLIERLMSFQVPIDACQAMCCTYSRDNSRTLRTLIVRNACRPLSVFMACYGAQNEAYMSRSAEKWVRGLCFNELGVCG